MGLAMLIYHPAFDVYHTSFRYLRLLLAINDNTFEYDRISIIDYFLIFPSELSKIVLPRDLHYIKPIAKALENPYNCTYNQRITFRQLEACQALAVELIYANGLFDQGKFEKKILSLIPAKLDEQLYESITQKNKNDSIMDFLINKLSHLELYGPRGLKERTNLKSTNYDAY